MKNQINRAIFNLHCILRAEETVKELYGYHSISSLPMTPDEIVIWMNTLLQVYDDCLDGLELLMPYYSDEKLDTMVLTVERCLFNLKDGADILRKECEKYSLLGNSDDSADTDGIFTGIVAVYENHGSRMHIVRQLSEYLETLQCRVDETASDYVSSAQVEDHAFSNASADTYPFMHAVRSDGKSSAFSESNRLADSVMHGTSEVMSGHVDAMNGKKARIDIDPDEPVQFCKKCGRVFSMKEEICPYCGNYAREVRTPEPSMNTVYASPRIKTERADRSVYPEEPFVRCNNCRQVISVNADACPYCGNYARTVNTQEPPMTTVYASPRIKTEQAEIDFDPNETVQICQKCGRVFSMKEDFCPYCGNYTREVRVQEPSMAAVYAAPWLMTERANRSVYPEEPYVRCKNCGKVISVKADACPFCGNHTRTAGTQESPTTTGHASQKEMRDKKKKGLLEKIFKRKNGNGTK